MVELIEVKDLVAMVEADGNGPSRCVTYNRLAINKF